MGREIAVFYQHIHFQFFFLMSLVTLFSLGIGLFFIYQYVTSRKQGRPLPPGPKGLPIVGVSTPFQCRQ